MTATEAILDRYLTNFERVQREVATSEPAWFRQIREAAMASFTHLGFPTARNEEWRQTSVDPITKIPFQMPQYPLSKPMVENFPEITLGARSWHRLVFVNGYFSPELSSLRPMPNGVRVGSLAAALDTDPIPLQPHLSQYAHYEDNAFVALNTAFMRDGAFIFMPRNTVVQEPLHVLFVSTVQGIATISHPRNLIIAGPNSQATILESYVGPTNGVYFTNAVTELVLGENAILDHYVLQRESQKAFHIATREIHQDRSSHFSSRSMTFGGALVRTEVNALLDAEESECTLTGLFAGNDRHHVDTHVTINHAKPRCTSRQFYKGILDEHATGVFTGKISVQQNAQKTDARQINKNLLLSKGAVIHATPQLEILADDVTCTHGATVGQLDEEAIFYLRSRGISQERARSLMGAAFANEIIAGITLDPFRTYVSNLLSQEIFRGTGLKEATDV